MDRESTVRARWAAGRPNKQARRAEKTQKRRRGGQGRRFPNYGEGPAPENEKMESHQTGATNDASDHHNETRGQQPLPAFPTYSKYSGPKTLAHLKKRHDQLKEYIDTMKKHVRTLPEWHKRELACITAGVEQVVIGGAKTPLQENKSLIKIKENEDTGAEAWKTGAQHEKDANRTIWAQKQQADYGRREARQQDEPSSDNGTMYAADWMDTDGIEEAEMDQGAQSEIVGALAANEDDYFDIDIYGDGNEYGQNDMEE